MSHPLFLPSVYNKKLPPARGRSEVHKIIYNKGANIQKWIEYQLDIYFDCFLLSLTGLNLKD